MWTNVQAVRFWFLICFMPWLVHRGVGNVFGFMKMPYFKYLFSSFIAMLPTMICITVFGGEPSLTSPAFWIAVGIKVIVFAAAYFKNHKLAVEH